MTKILGLLKMPSSWIKIDEVLCGTIGGVSTFGFLCQQAYYNWRGWSNSHRFRGTLQKFKKMINLDFSEPQRFNHDNFY